MNEHFAKLGVELENSGDVFDRIKTLHGHTFAVPPVYRYHSKAAEQKFTQLFGGINPTFNLEKFEALRERMQVGEKREKDAMMTAMLTLQSEFLCKAFTTNTGLDLAEFERMFYPNYAPRYDDAIRAVGLKKPFYWRRGRFTMLENISRLPLEQCNEQREAKMSFEDYYSLFLNYYHPFNALAYLMFVTSQNFVFTKELVDSTCDYLNERLALLDADARKAPILFLGPRIGKFGGLLNATGKLPVPVIHTHERPLANPYFLMIPTNKQEEFKLHPVIKMKNQQALDKYQPSIVLMSNMTLNTDETFAVRGMGCVREYLYFGLIDSYAEGHPWETYGQYLWRQKDKDQQLPPFFTSGFMRCDLPFISRWMLTKHDSDFLMGTGGVAAFQRFPLYPSRKQRALRLLKRIKPFF